MEPDLLGHLLKALDDDGMRQVEAHLRDHPDAAQKLGPLQNALAQLADDGADLVPPPDLWQRTIAQVARERCRALPPAPRPSPDQRLPTPRLWWRRADLLVAALLLLTVGGLLAPLLLRSSYYQQRLACQNNLKSFYYALANYSDRYQGDFPRITPEPPCNVAGMAVPMLRDTDPLRMPVSVSCVERQPPSTRTVRDLVELREQDPDRHRREVVQLLGYYAYSLGYNEPDDQNRPRHNGLRWAPGLPDNDTQPIMADRPPCNEGDGVHPGGNSPNHAGRGQNVLFVGGNVRFVTGRGVGSDDDIYLNRQHQLDAGVGRRDSVLGPSWTGPATPDD